MTGSYDWADLGNAFTKLLLTCFKKGEDLAREVEYGLWDREEGRVDDLVNYMKQRLRDYEGEQLTRRQRRAAMNKHSRNSEDSQEHQTRKQVIAKA